MRLYKLTQQIPTPSILTESVGNNMSACVLRDNMGGANNVVLQCKNQNINWRIYLLESDK